MRKSSTTQRYPCHAGSSFSIVWMIFLKTSGVMYSRMSFSILRNPPITKEPPKDLTRTVSVFVWKNFLVVFRCPMNVFKMYFTSILLLISGRSSTSSLSLLNPL